MTTPTLASTEAYNEEIAGSAVRFAASLFLGRGQYDNAEATSLDGILAAAAELKARHADCVRDPVITAFDADGNPAVISGKARKPAKPKKPAKAKEPKAPKAKAEPKTKPLNARAQIAADAAAGIIPPAPDFSAETHKRFRKKLEELVALVDAADIKRLRALVINPVSSSLKAMLRYRDLAVAALEARRKARPQP